MYKEKRLPEQEQDMAKIGVFFAEGYEEIEGLTVVDLCRRAGIEVETVSVYGKQEETGTDSCAAYMVCGSHGIDVKMDRTMDQVDFGQLDMIVLPGGLPGTTNLEASCELMAQLDAFYESGKYIAAICAAPSIFGHRGYLNGRKATCYPSFESHLTGAQTVTDPAVTDGNVITGRGMGCAIDFSMEIIKALISGECAKQIADAVIYTR